MGDPTVQPRGDGVSRRRFMRQLLDDLRALELMLDRGLIEAGVRRIGVEQELFLVDRNWRPASHNLDILEDLDDPHFTTELGRFNLELNLDPLEFGTDCLSRMERQLTDLLDRLRAVAARRGIDVVLTGILPTLRKSDLGLENMTPIPRYHALNDAMNAMRGGAYEFHIRGLDELIVRHDSVMLEACNASFQVHFQVAAEEFAHLYNIAQLVSAPVLAACVNSPLLFGRQLWSETRIALFQQAVDTRGSTDFLRELSPRVTFGNRWVRQSVVEMFQEDISRFRTLVSSEPQDDPLAELRRGQVPRLKALCLHNSTVYRWNRACFGFTNGKPHLRIENRILPSGPSIADEVANAAFWFGLIAEFADMYDDVRRLMDFEDAKFNFTAAARLGLGAQFNWFEGQTLPAARLICDSLIPLARSGLKRSGIVDADIERYLEIIERRVGAHRTGAQWMVNSLTSMRGQGSLGEGLNSLTAAMVARQRTGEPISQWELARLDESGGWKHNFLKVEQFMSTDLFTVGQEESLDLVACLMEWEKIRHVPVEDSQHRLVGLVSYRSLLRLMARGTWARRGKQVPVSEVMKRNPVTIEPEASTLEAIKAMRGLQISCLPVVKDGHLVGIITERDLMDVAAELLEQQFNDASGDEA